MKEKNKKDYFFQEMARHRTAGSEHKTLKSTFGSDRKLPLSKYPINAASALLQKL